MGPFSPDSPQASADPMAAERNLQPFFILHKGSKNRTSRHRKSQRRNDLQKLSPTKKRKLEGKKDEECDDYACEQLRIETFKRVWSKIESTIKGVLGDFNSGTFNRIHQWVIESFDAIKSSGDHSSGEVTQSFSAVISDSPKRVFAGVVVTKNMEFVDDILTFEELGLSLKSHGCLVAKLSSLDFTVKTGIGGCLKALSRQIIKSSVDIADMSVLASWYREQGKHRTPLVLIINDLERCCGSVSSDFILLLSEWLVKLPIILIIGVTTLDALRKTLSSNAIQHLRPFKFMLGSPAERMDAVVEAVLVKHSSLFGISHKVAYFLKSYFLNQDGTLASFTRALKIALSLHFSLEPSSFALGSLLVEEYCKSQEGKYETTPDIVMNYISDLPLSVRNQIVDESLDNVAQGVTHLMRTQRHWGIALMCLYEAGKFDNVRLLDLFSDMLDPDIDNNVVSDNNVQRKKNFELSLSNDPYLKYSFTRRGGSIVQIVRKVRGLSKSMLQQLIKNWEKLSADVSEIHEKVKELYSHSRCEDGMSSKHLRARAPKRPLSARNGDEEINSLAAGFIDWLIRNYRKPMNCIPFHEIMCFKDVENLVLALIGDPRRRVQVDLLESYKVLRCSCCSKRGNTVLPSMHDSSIMYSMTQEHGDLINLHDWFQSFETVVYNKAKRKQKTKQSLPKKSKGSHEAGGESAASVQARFCRSVAELQITGLLRMPSKRRPDFVQRISFGL